MKKIYHLPRHLCRGQRENEKNRALPLWIIIKSKHFTQASDINAGLMEICIRFVVVSDKCQRISNSEPKLFYNKMTNY